MKKAISLLLCVSVCASLYAQNTVSKEDSTYQLDVLQAPSSPVANMLGVAPNEVQKPTDPTALMTSAQTAAKNFSGFPSSYAVDIAPAWMFSGAKIKYSDFASNKFKDNVWQNFVLSVGYNNAIDTLGQHTDIGIGAKISFFRGHIKPKTDTILRQAANILSTIQKVVFAGQLKIRETQAFKDASEDIQNKMLHAADSIAKASVKQKCDSLKKIAQALDFERYGWKLDLAMGTVVDFPNQIFDKGNVSRGGVWLTGGYQSLGGFSALGIIRYQYNPQQIYADTSGLLKQKDVSTLDFGARVIYKQDGSKFSFGSEFIYRSVLDFSIIKPTYRAVLNVDYKLKANTILTMSLGRDFDGVINKDGNVIAAMNLILGLGNGKKII